MPSPPAGERNSASASFQNSLGADRRHSSHHGVFAAGALSSERGRASHRFTVPSVLTDASRFPSGLNPTPRIELGLFNVSNSSPLTASHSFTIPSELAELADASRFPSGLNAGGGRDGVSGDRRLSRREAAEAGMNVVTDTNVVISAIFWADESRQCMVLLAKRRFHLTTTFFADLSGMERRFQNRPPLRSWPPGSPSPVRDDRA